MSTTSNLPALPANDHISSKAVLSVHSRGFYDTAPVVTSYAHIMAQLIRLGEEIGEVMSARHKRAAREAQAVEVADVYIVVCQIAWLTGLPGAMQLGRMAMPGTTLSIEYGELCRALRKWDGSLCNATGVHYALMRLAGLCYIMVDQCGQRLETLVDGKLAQDELRGYQHGGVQDGKENQGH